MYKMWHYILDTVKSVLNSLFPIYGTRSLQWQDEKKGLVLVFTNREVPVSAAGEHKRVMEKMLHVAEQVSSVALRANGGKPHVPNVEQSFSGSCVRRRTSSLRKGVRSKLSITIRVRGRKARNL